MKKMLALLIVAVSLSACPEKAPKAVAENGKSSGRLFKSRSADKPVKMSGTSIKPVSGSVSPIPSKKKSTYTITYPAAWELKPKFMGTDTMALSRQETPQDDFRENINVVIERVQVSGRKAYYEANLTTMKKMMSGFKIVSTTDIKLGSGLDAINLVYLHKMGAVSAKNRAVFIYEKGAGYVITATAKPSTFKQFNPQFEKIIQSFRLN